MGYLGLFPFAYVGFILLIRVRVPKLTPGVWLDGITAGLAVAALSTAVVLQAVLSTTSGSLAAVATNLAYPLEDALLLALVVGAFSATNWRPGRAWLLLGSGLAILAAADSLYLYQVATNSYVGGTFIDATWPAAMVLLANAALYEREPELLGHTRGVAALAVDVGRKLGLEGGKLEELERAAQLHDIGKIAVPDQILRKPGALTEDEWVFIRQHTLVGQRILAASPALRRIGDIVRATHERWDGAGYPDGLPGTDIPLPARIIAVCDAYDAMTMTRPYRPALSPAEAVAELERCSGSQFDPTIVAVVSQSVQQRIAA